MDQHKLKKLYPEYKKALENGTQSKFFLNLKRKEIDKNTSLKSSSSQLMIIKRQLRDYHNNKIRKEYETQNIIHRLDQMLENISIDDPEDHIDYDDYDDSYFKEKYYKLKRIILDGYFNNSLNQFVDDLHILEQETFKYGYYPYWGCQKYKSLIENYNWKPTFLKILGSILIVSDFDRITSIKKEIDLKDPDLIAEEQDGFSIKRKYLIKVGSYQLFDPNIVGEWRQKYGSNSKIILIDFSDTRILNYKYEYKGFEIWNRLTILKKIGENEINLNSEFSMDYLHLEELSDE